MRETEGYRSRFVPAVMVLEALLVTGDVDIVTLDGIGKADCAKWTTQYVDGANDSH
jgi:hypothetical protein